MNCPRDLLWPSILRPSAASPISRAWPLPKTRSKALGRELNAILAFVEQLADVDVAGVEPMTSVTPMAIKTRKDEVNDGEIADAVLANAPEREDHFFVVPKVVE